MLNKILIANRGEIAVRVIRTAAKLGYRTVAVYSDADHQALHVLEADESVRLGPAPVGESYLDQEAVLDAAQRTGADAIHPGYGFLSENAGFARACEDAGLTFIGPSADAIELMGSKRRSKIAMQEAGVPVVPGFEADGATDEALIEAAGDIGYPLMIKASAGGGGRGMRLVNRSDQLADEIARARSEARSAFGDDELILEKAVIQPRHIEIQVFADRHGNTIHLGERDCSIQRRHQKVVEEAPSPFVTPELRDAMGQAAVRAAKACGYVGAGTVEFLADADGHFYFLEMNTRLQVEHPVTERVTGQDLVAWQLAVAEGKNLPLAQDDVTLTGHAIEVRLYAEDPANGFTPQTGTLACFAPTEGNGIRVDAGVRSGDVISPFYDPMLAKVIASGPTRDDARRRLRRALEDMPVFGVTTNRAFLARIMADPVFGAGDATTAFLDEAFADDESMHQQTPSLRELALSAVLLNDNPQGDGQRWSNSLPAPVPFHLSVADQRHNLSLTWNGNDVTARSGEDTVTLTVLGMSGSRLDYIDRGVRQHCQYHRLGDRLYLQQLSRSLTVDDVTHAPKDAAAGASSGRLLASMDGAIIDVMVTPGTEVSQGDTLVVLEAMKMEHPLTADRDGRVEQVHVTPGTQVSRRQVLVELADEQETDA